LHLEGEMIGRLRAVVKERLEGGKVNAKTSLPPKPAATLRLGQWPGKTRL
jgi:hypothetical protein